MAKKTLVGLPAASFFGQPANLPPAAGQAGAARAQGGAPQLGPRQHDQTHEVSLADMSLASFSADIEAKAQAEQRNDATEDVSLHELSLSSQKPSHHASPSTTGLAAEQPLGFASTMPPPQAPTKPGGGRRLIWAGAALPVLLGIGWLLLGRTAPREAPPPPALAVLPPAAAPAGAQGAAEPAPPPSATDAKGALDSPKGGPSADGSGDDAQLAAARKRADAQVAQANGLRKRRKLGAARGKYQAALTIAPGHPGALHGLTLVAMQQRDGKQAVELARQLVEASPGQLGHQVLLGDAYKLAGKPKEAREVWQAAARKGSSTAKKRLK